MGETPSEFYFNSDVAFLHFRLKQDNIIQENRLDSVMRMGQRSIKNLGEQVVYPKLQEKVIQLRQDKRKDHQAGLAVLAIFDRLASGRGKLRRIKEMPEECGYRASRSFG